MTIRFYDKNKEIQFKRVLSYKTIREVNNLFALTYKIDEKQNATEYQIMGITAIVSCQIQDIKEELLFALCIDTLGETKLHLLEDYMDSVLYREKENMIIDYDSYLRICDFTNEKKLSPSEYIKYILTNSESLSIHTLIRYHGENVFFNSYEESLKTK
jgi:hypothetical protein